MTGERDNPPESYSEDQIELYLWEEGQSVGPFSEASVREQVISGQIDNRTLGRRGAGYQHPWIPVGDILADIDKWREERHGQRFTEQLLRKYHPDELTDLARPRKWVIMLILVLGALGAAAIQLLFAWPDMIHRTHEASRGGAYIAATNFLMEELVGVQRVAEQGKATILQSGDQWSVSVRVDGLNAFGGPVRKDVTVEMGHSAQSGFYFRSVRQ